MMTMAATPAYIGGSHHQAPRLVAHGAVSEYEAFNIPEKLHNKYIPVDESSDDVLPLTVAPPVPVATRTYVTGPDPKLSITPDKLGMTLRTKEQFVLDPRLDMTPDKSVSYTQRLDPALCVTPEPLRTTMSRIQYHDDRIDVEILPDIDPDPLLAVTPDRPTPNVLKSKSTLRSENNDPKSKVKHKVRFDVEQSINSSVQSAVLDNLNQGPQKSLSTKSYQPNLYAEKVVNNDDEFFNTEPVESLRYTVTRYDNAVPRVAGKNEKVPQIMDQFKPMTNRRDKTKHDVDSSDPGIVSRGEVSLEVVLPNTNKSPPKRKVVVTKEFEERPTEYQFPFNCGDTSDEHEHVFARPEYNNSLKVYSQIKEVGQMVPDVGKALKEHLQMDDVKRTEINEKASLRVNQDFCANQYAGLVGLDAPISDICERTEKLACIKSKNLKCKLKKSPRGKEPDLLEFFSPAFQKQMPDFHLSGEITAVEELSTAPFSLAFDLYRHNRVWEDPH